MTIYKRQIKYVLHQGGGQGFREELKDLTGWQDEDVATSLEKVKQVYRDYSGYIEIVDRYIKL